MSEAVKKDLEQLVEEQPKENKPGFIDGFKLGAGYVIDPFGAEVMENWENAAVNGKPLHKNHSNTFFDMLSEGAHKGNSFSKYAGIGTGLVGVAAVGVTTGAYLIVPIVTGVSDVYMTYKFYTPSKEVSYKPNLIEGFMGGLGIGFDPAGFYLENFERNFINGKGIDENRVKSAAQYFTKDARKGNSVAKYVGGVTGLIVGAGVNLVTSGAVAGVMCIYDVVASIRNKPKEKSADN